MFDLGDLSRFSRWERFRIHLSAHLLLWGFRAMPEGDPRDRLEDMLNAGADWGRRTY